MVASLFSCAIRHAVVGAAALLPLSMAVAAPPEPYVVKDVPGVEKNRLLPPSPGNPRNSEGDFIELKDGRVLFVYTHFTGGGSDHATASLVARSSSDGGKTWTAEDVPILENEADMNIMSVSLLRLKNGEIALFYLAKNSLQDCRPRLRISRDEAKTWSDAVECIAEPGYYVMNNDRAVQLESGRLLLPVALHSNDPKTNSFKQAAEILCHFSDDGGKTWQAGKAAAHGESIVLQEPGVVTLKDGRLLNFCRTPHGSQYVSTSSDDGVSWSTFEPSNILSPQSPATIERIPSTGDLLLAWNNHEDIAEELRGKRTPFNVAISRDDGRTWENVKTLEDDPNGWYCYTAMQFVDGHVLLGHCAGDRRAGGLATTQITRFPVAWLYEGSTGESKTDTELEK
ncbi:MAG: sialidase family protein [Planctomycetaceae bacterium]